MRAFKKFVQRISRWAIAIGLLPLLWSLGHQLAAMGKQVAAEGVKSWWMYAAGAGAYLAFERVLTRPMWLYVVGHELTHAASGLLSGARIYSMRAGSKGGEVQLSKSNGFIALSPYIVPFYAVLVVVIYAAVKKWVQPAPAGVGEAFQILLGISLAFHFSLTFSALHLHQSDLKVIGFFLSGVIIAVGNALILGVLGVSLFTKTPTLRFFVTETARETAAIWTKGLKFCMNNEVKRFNPLTPPPPKLAKNPKNPKDRTTWTR